LLFIAYPQCNTDVSNESQFRDVYRFFSISLPKAKLDRLCFRVIMGRIVSVIFLFCIFARKLISAMAYRDISMPDMLRKHSYLSEVIFAGSLHKSQIEANMKCWEIYGRSILEITFTKLYFGLSCDTAKLHVLTA